MHGSVIDFLRSIPVEKVAGKYVLEIGSCDVNGSPRDVLMDMKPRIYLGIDINQGKGVDMVLNAENLLENFKQGCIDIVVSTEMLEHVKDWARIIWQMKAVTKIGGLLIITTRSPGFPKHDYPNDYWRFTKEDFEIIFSDMNIVTLKDDPMIPGVLMVAEKVEEINVESCPDNLKVYQMP